jgi:hypothetical protein
MFGFEPELPLLLICSYVAAPRLKRENPVALMFDVHGVS